MNKDSAFKFVIRRAYRFGEVRRIDIQKAFSISQASAANILTEVIKLHWDILEVSMSGAQNKRKHVIHPRAGVKAPSFANEEHLLQQLTKMQHSFAETGLSPEELNVNYVNTSIKRLSGPGIFSVITQGIAHKKIIDITYIGMKAMDQPKRRTVSPIGLENMHGQWRLLAVDAPQTPESIVKTFVLSRVMEASFSLSKHRYSNMGIKGREVKVEVTLNPLLNKHQEEAVRVELNMDGNTINVPERGKFEYLQKISNQKKNDTAIWPPVLLR
ncbi:MAG: hypothetical protein CTY38_01170 [Methylotenera sp.]|uniref:WYL domain-containing protein n=1 Tax=Methylotenera sp. TaxID=2051956 RepID=UPI000D40DEFA|nr:WYL domain-containing protein [Methylotenera sp.]PPC84687.1 MAG: hypothetical protein CTY38_01170 [Methylotenera sp.]